MGVSAGFRVGATLKAIKAGNVKTVSRKIQILGISFTDANLGEAVSLIQGDTGHKQKESFAFVGLHTLADAQVDDNIRAALSSFDHIFVDGVVVRFIASLLGEKARKRAPGPDVMASILHSTDGVPIKHCIYGGDIGAIDDINDAMSLSGGSTTQIVPPYKELTSGELRNYISQINEIAPYILWVALGAPAQEVWIAENKHALNARRILGIGAAVKFLAGRKRRAPMALRRCGLEWAWRILSEPRHMALRDIKAVTILLPAIVKELRKMRSKSP